MYAEKFLEFRDEPVSQVLVQWVKLFPVARLRVNDQRLADRLEMLLKHLHAKFSKIPRTSLILATIEEIAEKIRSPAFLNECRDFMANKNQAICAKEIQIDQLEQEESKTTMNRGAGSQLKKNSKRQPRP